MSSCLTIKDITIKSWDDFYRMLGTHKMKFFNEVKSNSGEVVILQFKCEKCGIIIHWNLQSDELGFG
jgi:hypothetical protein